MYHDSTSGRLGTYDLGKVNQWVPCQIAFHTHSVSQVRCFDIPLLTLESGMFINGWLYRISTIQNFKAVQSLTFSYSVMFDFFVIAEVLATCSFMRHNAAIEVLLEFKASPTARVPRKQEE